LTLLALFDYVVANSYIVLTRDVPFSPGALDHSMEQLFFLLPRLCNDLQNSFFQAVSSSTHLDPLLYNLPPVPCARWSSLSTEGAFLPPVFFMSIRERPTRPRATKGGPMHGLSRCCPVIWPSSLWKDFLASPPLTTEPPDSKSFFSLTQA